MKIKWRVQPAPTGRYRSFEKRGWPEAYYDNEEESIAAMIYCDKDYYPCDVKSGDHPELTITIADHSAKPNWVWRKLKKRAATLQEAKDLVAEFLLHHPEYKPLPVKKPTLLKRRTQ